MLLQADQPIGLQYSHQIKLFKNNSQNREWMILAMIFKFDVYNHNIYIYVSIFSGNILYLSAKYIFSHFF